MIRIAIVDDHPLIVDGLQTMLRLVSDIEITGAYTNGNALLKALAANLPDVLIIDIQMPDKMGPELAKIIRQKHPTVRMIALTNLDNNYYVKSMLRQGVLGYVLKSSDQDVLMHAIKTVYCGEEYLDPDIREGVWKDMVTNRRNASTTAPLTSREKEVLILIANECTTPEIASRLFLSINTIETHRVNLLLKLDAKNTAGLVKKAMQMGLVE
jgi:DNA-binding NarL/FixJ family response regulator